MASRRKRHNEDEAATEHDEAEVEEQTAKNEHLFHGGDEEKPRFNEEGAPIDANGLPRAMDPGEFPPDDVERSLWTVGKGGLTARGKLYVEGEAILLSDVEAEQILDRGDKVEHADPVAGKRHAEVRAERQAARAAKHAEAHEAAAAEMRDA
jgi:hypothetical protein